MLYSTAIFVDFENLRKGVFDKTRKSRKWFFDYNSNPQKVVDFCNLCVFDSFDEKDLKYLYRIFFYTARPSKDHKSYEKIDEFLRSLESLNHTAVRLGKLVKRKNGNNDTKNDNNDTKNDNNDTKNDNNYTIVQKQVDMLLGIDMAEISIKKFVNKVTLIGYDSDMSPALKLARCNGIQTEIILFEDLSKNIEPSLSKHCDIIKKVKIEELYKKLKIIE